MQTKSYDVGPLTWKASPVWKQEILRIVLPVLLQVGAKADAATDIFASRVTSPGLLFWCC
jgi:hypothetical protein